MINSSAVYSYHGDLAAHLQMLCSNRLFFCSFLALIVHAFSDILLYICVYFDFFSKKLAAINFLHTIYHMLAYDK